MDVISREMKDESVQSSTTLDVLSVLNNSLIYDLIPIIYEYYAFGGVIARQFNLGLEVMASTLMPSGKVVIASWNQIMLFDPMSGDSVVVKPIQGYVSSMIAVSSDTIGYGFGVSNKLFVLNLITGEEFSIKVKFTGSIRYLSSIPTVDAPDSFLVSFNGDNLRSGVIVLWDLVTQKSSIIKQNQSYVVGITVPRTSEVVFATINTLQVRNMQLDQVRYIQLPCKIITLTSLRDTVIVGCHNNILLINPRSRKITAKIPVIGTVRQLTMLPSEKLVGWVGGTLEVRDLHTGKVEHILKMGNRGKIMTLPDASIIYISGYGEITVYV